MGQITALRQVMNLRDYIHLFKRPYQTRLYAGKIYTQQPYSLILLTDLPCINSQVMHGKL